MASKKMIASGLRAVSLSAGGFQPLRGVATTARGLPNVGPIAFPAAPLSCASRGLLPTARSVWSPSTLQSPASTCLRHFSSSRGKMPAWMYTDQRPEKIFRRLDYQGQDIVVLCYHLIEEKGQEIDDSASAMVKGLERNLRLKIDAVPDKIKIKVDSFAIEKWLRTLKHVLLIGGGIQLYNASGEFKDRFWETCGQLRKHAPEIVNDLSKAHKDSVIKPDTWPFVKFPFHVKDDWLEDPIKKAERAERAAKKAKKLAKKGKKTSSDDGGGKK